MKDKKLFLRSVHVEEALVQDHMNEAVDVFKLNTVGPQKQLLLYLNFCSQTLPLLLLSLGLTTSPPIFPIRQTSKDLVPRLVVILNFFTPRPHYICRDDLSPPYLPRLVVSCCRSAFTPLRQPSLSLKQALTWSHNLHPASAVCFFYILYYPAQSCLEHPLFHYSFCGQIPIMLPFCMVLSISYVLQKKKKKFAFLVNCLTFPTFRSERINGIY